MKAQRLTMQAFGIWTELAENISVFDHKRRRGLSRSRRANLVSLLNQSFKIDVTLYISGKILFFKFDMEAESETSLLVNEDATIILFSLTGRMWPRTGCTSLARGGSELNRLGSYPMLMRQLRWCSIRVQRRRMIWEMTFQMEAPGKKATKVDIAGSSSRSFQYVSLYENTALNWCFISPWEWWTLTL